MFFDAHELDPDSTLEADLCIVGAGAGGLSLALELDEHPLRVILLESGRFKYDRKVQALYKGTSIGRHYEDLHVSRSRFFGGSSNCWAGFCRPLDPHDFEPREWVPDSGWPIQRSDLDSSYLRAHEILDLGPPSYQADGDRNGELPYDQQLLSFQGGRAVNLLAQLSPPTRLGSRYREVIARSRNISAYLDANVTEIETPGNGAIVAAVHGRTLGGSKFVVKAHRYVLATGGIETPRLLLASNRHQAAGVGNNHDVVGRYFMDHPRLLMGEIRFKHPERNSRIYDMHHRGSRRSTGSSVRLSGFFGLTADTQREERILNARCCVKSQFLGGGHKATVASITLLRAISERRPLLDRSRSDLWNLVSHLPHIGLLGIGLAFNPKCLHRAFRLETVLEPTPLRDSRVTLTNQRDALGVPRPQLDWKLGDLEKRTIRRTQEILRDELDAPGEAAILVNAPEDDQPWPDELTGCWHHMGTARMHEDPRKGVTDCNCRVHGVSNLFIAGGAVLPTVGSDMPTLTIVALAVRLAGHLKALHGLS